MSHLYPTLDRRRLIQDAERGRVRRNTVGDWVHQRVGTVTAVPAGRHVTALINAGWLTETPDGRAQPTDTGRAVAGMTTRGMQ
jgi:hypothetical protein